MSVTDYCRTKVSKAHKSKIAIDMRSDIQKIFTATPHNKQVMMFTATLSSEIKDTCRKFMRNPTEVLIESESKLTLHGLK